MPGISVAPNPRSGVAALPWNQWQDSRGISGSFAMEWPAAFVWNQWQDSRGIGGSFAVESVAAFARNTHEKAPSEEPATLANFLREHIGVLHSSEHVSGGAHLSEDSGRKFSAVLTEQRKLKPS
jgi:hypothetical protein